MEDMYEGFQVVPYFILEATRKCKDHGGYELPGALRRSEYRSDLWEQPVTHRTSFLGGHLRKFLHKSAQSPVNQQRLLHQFARAIEVSIDEYVIRADISVQRVGTFPCLLVHYDFASTCDQTT